MPRINNRKRGKTPATARQNKRINAAYAANERLAKQCDGSCSETDTMFHYWVNVRTYCC